MLIQKRTMNWLPLPSAYSAAKASRERRKALADEFIARQSSIADAFSGIQTNTVAEQGNLVSRVAAARLKKTA